MSATPHHPVKMIVGLGNPGENYSRTRHNAGAWFLEHLSSAYNTQLSPEKKFFGMTGRIVVNNQTIHLLVPTTFMNCSGRAVVAMANFYRVAPESIFVAHDELDFPAGVARLKRGGGHGGHNGLRDIIQKLGNNKNFMRLRIGIGHPGDRQDVTGYVLKSPSKAELALIDNTIIEALRVLPEIILEKWNNAVQQLHRADAKNPSF